MNDVEKVRMEAQQRGAGRFAEVFRIALKLGLTSFGGPVAHIGYFREEYVKRRQWLDENEFADLVALCQFLPGPASSKVGISIGMLRAGWLGGFAAWLGFTLPSAVAMTLFAYALRHYAVPSDAGWLHGLMLVAVAVVALAVWGMARNLAPDRMRGSFAIAAAIVSLAWPTAYSQIAVIAGAALAGWLLLPKAAPAARETRAPDSDAGGKRSAAFAWALFVALLLGLPLLRSAFPSYWLSVVDSFFRTGSLVFGGGHVVFPLLQAEAVPAGWLSDAQFLAGYGAAQAVPGPLFTFAAYVGATMHGSLGAIVATAAIFAPSFLLVAGSLPFWRAIRSRPGSQVALQGINAAVVGILLAALYNPVWSQTVHTAADFAVVLAAFALLALWKLPPWLVVLLTAAGSALLAAIG